LSKYSNSIFATTIENYPIVDIDIAHIDVQYTWILLHGRMIAKTAQ